MAQVSHVDHPVSRSALFKLTHYPGRWDRVQVSPLLLVVAGLVVAIWQVASPVRPC